MSLAKVTQPAWHASDWTGLGTLIEKQRLGFIAVSLTNMLTTSAPKIALGSAVEVSGTLYLASADDTISGSPTAGLNYIMGTVSGNNISFSYTTTAPVWNTEKQGWYSAGGTERYVGQVQYDGTAAYTSKVAYGSDYHVDRLVQGGVTIQKEYVLDQAVTKGDPVGLTIVNHMAKVGFNRLIDFVDSTDGANVPVHVDVADIGDNRFVMTYLKTDTVKARIGDYSSGTLSWLTAWTTINGTTTAITEHYAAGIPEGTDKGKCVVFWHENTTYDQKARWIWYDGAGGIGSEAEETVYNGASSTDAYKILDARYIGNQRIVITGERMAASSFVIARVGHYSSGSGTSWDTTWIGVTAAGTDYVTKCCALDPDYFVTVGQTGGTVNVRVGHYTGGSITWDASMTAAITSAALLTPSAAAIDVVTRRFIVATVDATNNRLMTRVAYLSGGSILFDAAQEQWTGDVVKGYLYAYSGSDRRHAIIVAARQTSVYNVGATMVDVRADAMVVSIYPRALKTFTNGGYVEGGTEVWGAPRRLILAHFEYTANKIYVAVVDPVEYVGVAAESGSVGEIRKMHVGGVLDGMPTMEEGSEMYIDLATDTLGSKGELHVGRSMSKTEFLRESPYQIKRAPT
jgi:hypothetical protein